MRTLQNLATDIPGLLRAALLFNANTVTKEKVSLLWLKDGDAEVMIDLADGIADTKDPALTTPMKSYLSGLAEVGSYLKARKTTDEDGVSADDVERAAITLAFPKVAQDKTALDMLKKHLDALQEHGVIEKLSFNAGTAAASPAQASKPAEQAAPAQQRAQTAPAETAEKPDEDVRAERAARREARRQEDEARKAAEAKAAQDKPAPQERAAPKPEDAKPADKPAPAPATPAAAATPAPAAAKPAQPAEPKPEQPVEDAVETAAETVDDVATSPALRQRQETEKKRGFFKR